MTDTPNTIAAAFAAGAAEMRRRAEDAAHEALYDLTMHRCGGDLSKVSPADVSNAATGAIAALPLPTFDREAAVERMARAMSDDGVNWLNDLPGERKERWKRRARAALASAMGEE